MRHTIAPTIAATSSPLPNQPFFAWLRTQTALFIGQILAVGGAVGSIIALMYKVGSFHVPNFITPDTIRIIGIVVIYAHLVFLTIFILWLIRVLDDNRHGEYRASRVFDRLVEKGEFGVDRLSKKGREGLAKAAVDQVRTFKLWFLGFWCTMLGLYIVFAVEAKYQEFFPATQSNPVVGWHTIAFPFLAFAANNLSLFLIFSCFVVLYLPPKLKSTSQPAEDFAITDESLKDEADEHRSRQSKTRWCFGVPLSLFTLAYLLIFFIPNGNWDDYKAVFNALSGTINAVVVALMIARLDSKLIGLPPWLISILYFYSGIQPLFVVFGQKLDEFNVIRVVVLLVVFISKLYFFLIIVYSLQNGRLLNYFYCSPLLNQNIRKEVKKAGSESHTELLMVCSTIIGWFFIIYFVGSLLYYAVTLGSNNGALFFSPDLRRAVVYLHLPLLLVFIAINVVSYRHALPEAGGKKARSEKNEDPVLSRLRRFRILFLCFWVAMFAFYVVYAIRTYRGPTESTWSVVGFSVATLLLNNLMALFIFLCFSVLYFAVDDHHGTEKYKSLQKHAFLVCVVLTAVIPLLLFSIDRTNFEIADPAVPVSVIATLGGVLNAVAFALLFARLDSRLIRLPSLVISVLYAYSALQSLFVIFQRDAPVFGAIETSALVTAFGFKICFLMVILYALSSGRLRDHLLRFPFLNNRVNSIFDNQYEIKVYGTDKQFKYSIFREDRELYRAEEQYPTRKDCDAAVIDLINVMRKKENYYQPPPVQGTYWVQVKTSNNLLCESNALHSETEVNDLIDECVEMVPYCKYSRD